MKRWSKIAACLGILIGAGWLAGCATPEEIDLESRQLPYRCDDVVVVGRLVNDGVEPGAYDPDDLIGHGWFAATVKVRTTVHGARQPSHLPIRYFGHTYLREDADFMFVLEKHDDGPMQLATAQLMRYRPILAEPCGSAGSDPATTPS